MPGQRQTEVAALAAIGMQTRGLAGEANSELLRNIGISAHIDSGKTTLTERILFYTGRINAINEVKGKDPNKGAKMDSMELEREKGITIQSAATYTQWKDTNINIIDTPGHVDFTVEVERALRVLDGAIMVLCSVGGVQSQSITVDRQMKRYNVPRVAFINKLDRMGANPDKVLDAIREKLRLNAAMMQVPIGLEENHDGIVDIVDQVAYTFHGPNGEEVRKGPIPEDLADKVEMRRMELLERLGEVDEEMEEFFLMEEMPEPDALRAAIRRATIANTFVPVFMGSAFKNRGVQPLLDGVENFLPSPLDMKYSYLDLADEEASKPLACDAKAPLVALAFKLEESRFGQLTYVRVYQGSLKRGMFIRNSTTGKRVKLPRVVRMHSEEMEDVDEVGPGEIAALFGIECSSGDTFCDADIKDFNPSMLTMFVPEPVVSLAIKPKDRSDSSGNFGKALQRFQREDPTFRVKVDNESKETIISGMGELHLEVYLERMRREYKVDTIAGMPQVNYRETITQRAEFNYTHKKQSGGSGQFGRVEGYIEPLSEEEIQEGKEFVFLNQMIGNAIPPEYVSSVEKGFQESMEKGVIVGHPLQGVKVVLVDGSAHSVDSNEMAFKLAARGAFRQAVNEAGPVVLEPVMKVEIQVPEEYQGTVVGGINRRRGTILESDMEDDLATIQCEVPLKEMFGYSTEIRSATQAKGEFTMEFKAHEAMPQHEAEELIRKYKEAENDS
ncbi:Elongation factor G, mitochondrial [Hondaea fermentalgiana]|uniref:Elongation factor G, mitochondrial n=1 Tax=Hondaea fermentalgiana TaxID=2315210 RepID=A0A2R5GHT9_9STRA|nr:Elongation factor G, mitochondrial [Hondaea fermentalgiana]|eukprot:GBG29288.1 Elongation factor G, mitochondrial [Hondaea fermentalgiana]